MQNIKIYFSVLLLIFFISLTSITSASIDAFPGDDTITFIHLSDPHVCNLTAYHPFFIEKRQHFGNNTPRLTEFLKTIPKRTGSNFIVITGDNIDYFEAQTETHGVLGTQVEQYSRLLDVCNVPVFLTLGNHDIASFFVSPELKYTNNQLSADRARATWMKNVNCFKDGTYYSRIFTIDTTTFRLIFLDNGYYGTKELSDPALPFLMDQYQLLWLDDQLNASKSDVEIIFMHIPLPIEKFDNKEILSEPIATYSQKNNYYNILNVLEKHSSTRLLFVGHRHTNNINSYSFSNGNKVIQVMTGCFGRVAEANNWRVIKLTKNKIIIYAPGSQTEVDYIIQI